MAHDKFFGRLVDVNSFFLCGLPGGVDYALLFAVKHGWIHPLTEKRYNTVLNTWIRAPGIVMTSAIAWVVVNAKNPNVSFFQMARLLDLAMFVMSVWNAQFFMARVVANCHLRTFQSEQKHATQNVKNGVVKS